MCSATKSPFWRRHGIGQVRGVSSAEIIPFPPVDPAFAPVGMRVRSLREARGMSLDQLALEMRLERSVLARAEVGRARLSSSQLYAAALALHVPMRLLFEPGHGASMRAFLGG